MIGASQRKPGRVYLRDMNHMTVATAQWGLGTEPPGWWTCVRMNSAADPKIPAVSGSFNRARTAGQFIGLATGKTMKPTPQASCSVAGS